LSEVGLEPALRPDQRRVLRQAPVRVRPGGAATGDRPNGGPGAWGLARRSV